MIQEGSGWQPLRKPSGPSRTSGPPPAASPFTRLARTHAFSAAADGCVTVALAGSIFFSIDPSAARVSVALYLLLTLAPFAVVTPLIGPVIDRAKGGRRAMLLLTLSARTVVAFLMVRNMDSLLLFPLAFTMLVFQRAYAVAKSAMVPKLVRSQDELVEANSKLALLSSLAGMGGGGVAALFSLAGPPFAAALAVVLYAVGTIAATRLPKVRVADAPPDLEERMELSAAGILLASSAMGVLRGIVGFMTFLVAFEFRGGVDGVDLDASGRAAGAMSALSRGVSIEAIVGTPGSPAWHFGFVLLGAGIGVLVGARLAPRLRARVPEERIIAGALVGLAIGCLFGAYEGGVLGAFVVALFVSVAASASKLAFDALVQRDAPEANHGRTFAKFEGRFQLSWAVGALIPVVLPLGGQLGFFILGCAATFAAVTYVLGQRAAAESSHPARHGRTSTVVDPNDAIDIADPTIKLARPVDPDPTLVEQLPTWAEGEREAPSAAQPWVPGFDPIISAGEGVEFD